MTVVFLLDVDDTLRAELGYADYLGALQRYRIEYPATHTCSGHRGSALESSFNEAHILAVTQAICAYRRRQNIDGPLFLGIDTHALSESAFASALEVLAANGIDVMIGIRRTRDGIRRVRLRAHRDNCSASSRTIRVV